MKQKHVVQGPGNVEDIRGSRTREANVTSRDMETALAKFREALALFESDIVDAKNMPKY